MAILRLHHLADPIAKQHLASLLTCITSAVDGRCSRRGWQVFTSGSDCASQDLARDGTPVGHVVLEGKVPMVLIPASAEGFRSTQICQRSLRWP